MGFFIRKSKNLGLLKLNLSKSGLGFSFGVKGCRLSFNKKDIQLNAGRGGLYYRKSISRNKLDKAKKSDQVQNEELVAQNEHIENEPQKPKLKKITKTPEQEFFEFYLSFFTLLFIVGFVGLFFNFTLACLLLIFTATSRVLYIKHNADKYEVYKQNPEPQCYYIGHTKKQIEELERLKNTDKVESYNERTFKTCRFCGCVYDGDGECPACCSNIED